MAPSILTSPAVAESLPSTIVTPKCDSCSKPAHSTGHQNGSSDDKINENGLSAAAAASSNVPVNGNGGNGAVKQVEPSSSPAKSSHEQNGSASQDGDKRKGRHAGVGHKSILQSDALYQYVLETSVYPRESPAQRELREITMKHPWNLMTTPPDEGQFLMLLMKLINAKNTMELGVYTGYSLLSTALALPPDGKIIAIDMNRENYELGAPVIEKAGLSHKIDFREGLILTQLDELVQEIKYLGFFDFIFVDADKDNYLKYHERLLQLVKVGGLIGYDNTLWNGSLVAPEDAPYPKYVRFYRPFILELNRFLASDERIEISQVPIGDGITLCRRIM